MIYQAADLLTLEDVGLRPGKPAWANLRARPNPRWRYARELAGPGLYGLFLDDALFYVGLHTGGRKRAFGDSVLDRWYKHVVNHTLRWSELAFAPNQLVRVLGDKDSKVAPDLAACLPDGRDSDLSSLEKLPLTRGANATYNKARFASRHWDVFGPGAEDDLLRRITCVYRRLPDAGNMLDELPEADRYDFVKSAWLGRREKCLIRAFRPICNNGVKPGEEQDGIGAAAFEAELDRLIAEPLEPVIPSAAIAPSEPATTTPVNDTTDDTPDLENEPGSADEAAPGDDDGGAEAEFRRRLKSVEAEALIDELLITCPGGMNVYFTKRHLRLRLNTAKEPVLMTLGTSRGRLSCATRASVAACRAIGFADAAPVTDGPMAAGFSFNPAVHNLTALIAVAGAAAEAAAS